MPPQQPTAAPLDLARSKPRRSLETMSVWALIGTLVLAVFIVIPSASIPFVATKTFVLAAGALITLALYILARLGRGNVILPPLVLLGALWLPVTAYALSAAFSDTPLASALWGSGLEADTLGFMLVVTILGTMAALVLRRTEQYRLYLRAGAWAFMALVALQAISIIVGKFSSGIIPPSFSIAGSIANLAFLLGLGVVGILLALRELELSERTRKALLISGTGAVVLLAIANSSLVWTLLAIVALGLFVESVMKKAPKGGDADLDNVAVVSEEPPAYDEGNRSLILPLGLLAVSLFFLIGGTLGNALAVSLDINEINVRPSWQSTFSVGNSVFSSSPVFGSGPSTFGAEWLKYRDASLNSTLFWNINFSSGIGFIPTSFVTTGIVGSLAWIAFLVLLVVFGLRMLIRRAPQDAFIRFVAMSSFLASLYLFAIAIFDLPGTIVLALAFVSAGVFISTMRFSAPGAQWGIIFSRSPRLGFVIVFSLTILLLGSVVAAYSLVGRYIAITKLSAADAAFSLGDLDAADRAVQDSISFAPSAAAYQVAAGIARERLVRIAASSTMSASSAQKSFQDALSSGINAALTATSIAPSDYQNWLALGNLYSQAVPLGVAGAYDSAKAAYEKAMELNPTDPQILYILAQLNIANQDLKAAEEALKAAIALKQDYTAAIFLLSQIEVQSGNVKDALASALAAAYFTPNNPSILFQVGILYAAQGDLANAAAALSAAVDADPQFANARYFLSAVHAKRGDMKNALAQMQAVADMSIGNAEAVASQLSSLEDGKNPFPANLLSISAAPVQ